MTFGTIGSAPGREYSTQAARECVYDAPNERLLLVEGVSVLNVENEEYRARESQLEGNAAGSKKKEILEAGVEGGIDNQKIVGQHQRQEDALENSPTVPCPDSQAADASDAPRSSGPGLDSLNTVEAGEQPGEVCTGSASSEVAFSPTNENRYVNDDWQEFDDDFDGEDRQDFSEYESDSVETLEDLDMLRALNEKAVGEAVRQNNLQAYSDLKAQPNPEHESLNRTIHILGLGATGKYIAHSLAALPFAPPITLLMHRPLMMQHWHDEGAAIHVIKGGDIKTRTNFRIESSAGFLRQDSQQRFPGFGPRLEHTAEPPSYPIDALIITTEAYRTVSALTAIKHRLGRSSTVFLLNNGLGLVERINERVFTDTYNRPTYILGNMSHDLVSTERHFTLIEKNSGRLECSKLPQVLTSKRGRHAPILTRKDFSWSAHASHLVGTLARTPELRTLTLGHKSFYESQFQNLAAGAIIGPLSVVFDCTNDLILYNYNSSRTMKLLLHEISRVIRSLPELQSLPNLEVTFGVRRLEAIIVSKISKTGKNITTMLQNVRAGNRTNIDYYNGYIERRARELGIDTPRNEMMLHLVRGKSAAKSRELNNYIPFEDDF
ncbi:hypothetical protein IFR05_009754 [Cadophora sp. M221]|nr:hypothetical protein IFR05_009754 [Cadophora sp. M221]